MPKKQKIEQPGSEGVTKRSSKHGKKELKTLALTPELLAELKALADEEKVKLTPLVEHLLQYAVDQVKNGSYKIPIVVEEVRRIGP